MMWALIRLWRRMRYCRTGEHREGIVWDFGILTWHCVDCGSRRWIGNIDRWGTNKLHTHFPWERDDA